MKKATTKAKKAPALLTEEQILKMGDDEYMNQAQLDFFKARLLKMEQDLLRNAGQTHHKRHLLCK